MRNNCAPILGWVVIASFATECMAADPVPPGAETAGLSCDGSARVCERAWIDNCGNCDDCPNGLGVWASDHCFDRFISPLSNPFFFEDPRSLTEARGIFLDNSLPNFIGGGDAEVWAGQLRARISERVSIIAPRLGHLQVNPSGQGAPDGFMSAPVGLKYNFVRDVENQILLSGGVTYFIPGSQKAFSNWGDGDVHFFLSGGAEIFDGAHWLSGTGFRIPVDSNWGTQMWYWSNQWDYELPGHIYPLVGLNWFHWMRSAGVGIGAPVTALDLIDLPVNGVAGSDVVTCALGGKWKPNGHVEVGGGFEFPLTDRTDILDERVYVDLILRY